MVAYANGIYTVKNPAKYIGKHAPRYRSSWENVFMSFCDNNASILYWASEALSVQYRHPLTGRLTNYIPDFFVVYQNKYGKQIAEVVEIKPRKQSVIEGKMSADARATVAINHAKWAACQAFCKHHGYVFRVVTEQEIFANGTGRR